jgi:ribose 5-phosphate isomerase B
MKIAIATDHNGVNEKKELIRLLSKYEFLDKSPVNTDTDDYPDFAFEVANSVVSKEADLGVLLCGTGIGMSIAANKVEGVRCGHCSSVEQAHLTKEHNHANIIAISYKQDINEIAQMIKEFIETENSPEERHVRRVNKISNYETR